MTFCSLASASTRTSLGHPEARTETRALVESALNTSRLSVRPVAEKSVIWLHSTTVIRDTNELPSTSLNLNADLLCSRIDAIFDQFFNDRSGALNHFTCSNLIGELGR